MTVIKNSTTAGKLPTDLKIGELAVNLADKKLYTKEPKGNIIQISGVAKSGDTMTGPLTINNSLSVNGDILEWGKHVTANFDTLILNVSPTGKTIPTDPIGDTLGSGEPFNGLYNCLKWVSHRIGASRLIVDVKAGNYDDWKNVDLVLGGSITELFIYGDGVDTTQVQLNGHDPYTLNFNGLTLRLVGIHFTGSKNIRCGHNLQIGTPSTSYKTYPGKKYTKPADRNVKIDGEGECRVVGTFKPLGTLILTDPNAHTTVGRVVNNLMTIPKAKACKLYMEFGDIDHTLPAGTTSISGRSELQNGAVLQYGVIDNATAGMTVIYHTAFTYAIFGLFINYNDTTSRGQSQPMLQSGGLVTGSPNNNLTKFTINPGSNTGTISWLAIGL